jgi:hypothetical protein
MRFLKLLKNFKFIIFVAYIFLGYPLIVSSSELFRLIRHKSSNPIFKAFEVKKYS